jgi:hypothetical protein
VTAFERGQQGISNLAAGCRTVLVGHGVSVDRRARFGGVRAKSIVFRGAASGYTSAAAQITSVEGMRADCDIINLNKKLATDFLSGVFGPGLIGFFYKCENISPDTNK